MLRKPPIGRTRRTIHSTLNNVLTLIALPPMSPKVVDFIVEGVIDRNVEAAVMVDLVHFFEEFGAMTVSVYNKRVSN